MTKKISNGEFYTPPELIKFEINNYKKNLRTSFKEYTIWDPACGPGNLIKALNYKDYSNVYASTLYKEDLKELHKLNNINKFQYDFLNDPIEELPEELLDALKNKKILILLNPPYKGTSNFGSIRKNNENIENKHKSEVYKTMSNNLNIIGNKKCCLDLQAQFIYRLLNIKKDYNVDMQILMINPLFSILTKQFFKTFKEYIFENFNIDPDISLYNSKTFGTRGDFAICVSWWDGTNKQLNKKFIGTIYDKNLNVIGDMEVDIEREDYLYHYVNHIKKMQEENEDEN